MGRVAQWCFMWRGEGRYLFSFSDGSVKKIDDGTRRCSLCPYEIDWLSGLAIMNLVAYGSVSRDVGRCKVRGRWRRLMARHMNKKKGHATGKA